MSSEIAIRVECLSKCYQIYERPQDRLKQMILSRVNRLTGFGRDKYYRDFWALKEVSFEVRKGQTIGIIGRNGSGKSTLLQLICGTLNPTGGSITTHGRIAALLELGSGFNPEFTGLENVFLNARLLGLSKEETIARLDKITAFADIGEFINQPVKTYSSGMLVRLAFAVIAHVNADILIIDEALAVGDAFFTQKCMRFLRQFMKEGTVLFVSHDTNAVVNLCQHVIWLNAGAVAMSGSPEAVSRAYLASRYGEEADSTPDPAALDEAAANRQSNYEREIDGWYKTRILRGEENPLRIFKFDETAPSFGKGGARITNVVMLDHSGAATRLVQGGEYVCVSVHVHASEDIRLPIIGFFVKDRLGQILFGENTYSSYKDAALTFKRGERARAEFSFRMPVLPAGSYMLDAAIASGDDLDHVQLEWKHDAMVIESATTSTSTGLVGVPMRSVAIVHGECGAPQTSVS